MQIPVLVSRSGLTKMGYDVAAQVGITMIGRAVGKHYLLFTGAHRLVKVPSSRPSPKGEGALSPSSLGEGRGEGHG
jgi:FdhD/NarQ family